MDVIALLLWLRHDRRRLVACGTSKLKCHLEIWRGRYQLSSQKIQRRLSDWLITVAVIRRASRSALASQLDGRRGRGKDPASTARVCAPTSAVHSDANHDMCLSRLLVSQSHPRPRLLSLRKNPEEMPTVWLNVSRFAYAFVYFGM